MTFTLKTVDGLQEELALLRKCQAPRLFAILLLVPPLSVTVLDITTVRNPPDISLPFQYVRRTLPSKLRLAIRCHMPCVGGIGSHANGT